MKLLILTNNPERASFRQRIAAYLPALQAGGIDCEVAVFTSGLMARINLFRRAADFDGVLLHKKAVNPFDAYWLKKYRRSQQTADFIPMKINEISPQKQSEWCEIEFPGGIVIRIGGL